jgi:transporter family-2 protein
VVAGGCLLPVQASLNAAVAHVAGSSPFAAAISFGIGFLALVVITALGPIGRPKLGTLREAPFWAYLGGLTGAWFIFLGALLLPTLGATRMMGMVVGGQLLMGLVIDHFGWLGIPRRPLTPRRRLAAVLVVVAVALLSGIWGALTLQTLLAMVAAFSAGCGFAFGFSANAQVSRHTGHPLGGALMNFLVGTLALSGVVLAGFGGHPQLSGLSAAPWWTYLGGVCGAAFVTIGLVAIPRVGLAISGLATVFGQLAMSMVLDVTGLFGPALPLSLQKLGGAVVLLAAMWVMQGDQLGRTST